MIHSPKKQRSDTSQTANQAALDRALSGQLPIIPERDGDYQLRLLAAFCRELQRDAGSDKPFTIPINFVQRLFKLREIVYAENLLEGLEEVGGVIKRVEGGWRYLYPLE